MILIGLAGMFYAVLCTVLSKVSRRIANKYDSSVQLNAEQKCRMVECVKTSEC